MTRSGMRLFDGPEELSGSARGMTSAAGPRNVDRSPDLNGAQSVFNSLVFNSLLELMYPSSMNPKPKSSRAGAAVKLCLTLVAALALSACAGAPEPKNEEEGPETLAPDDANALVLGAEVALQRGQYLDATKAYVKAALGSKDEQLAEQASRVAFEHQQWSLVQAAARSEERRVGRECRV